MPRRRERLSPTVLGAIVVVSGVVLFFALLLAGVGRRMLTPQVTVRADFRTASGLRKGGTVRLAGVIVGHVSDIQFTRVQYACDPLTEDFGRYRDGRTDNCDADLFCTAERLCGDLEPWAGRGHHSACSSSEDCKEGETCVTSEFRRLFPHVDWSGPFGVCARAATKLWRTSVYMDIQEEALELVRSDSRAMVASASALGGLLVDISPGHADHLGPHRRIQSRPSVYEDMERLRERVTRFTAQADDAIISIANVIDELRDEPTIDALEGFFFNIERISRDLAQGHGVLGALLSAPRMRSDIGKIVAAFRGTSEGLEQGMQGMNRIAATIDRNAGPLIHDADQAIREVDAILVELADPENRSLVARLLRDPKGQMAADLSAVVTHTHAIIKSGAAITTAIDEGHGTLGKLIRDPVVRIQLGHFLSTFAQRNVLRALLRFVLERNGYPVSEAQSAAGPPD